MIPELWNELGTEKIGDLNDCLECFVEEERNGIFELTLEYPNGYPLADQLLKERIIVVNANDTLLNQKFRIYDTKKFINETITVFARHISFDLMYDYVNDITFENQSCEYALNSLFRQSQFSKHYRGYSDIVNAQNYSMSMCNILEAIGGKEGSIIDTFGTGAEILRDNTDIHVLNARGHDNGVTIEYGKNLTGFELSEDTTNLVTRILPYAKYTPEGGKETIVKGNFVDSPLINNYSHPYIKHIDYSDKFQDKKDTPTKEKLETLARNEYRDNKVDIPKTNFKIEFIPLSKCVGYEELEDKISICDKVTIKNTRYNVDTKSKVIKYKFDVIKERYESMELGEPRTTFGDVIGGGGDSQVGPQGPPGPPGADGNIGDFPNSLPQTPILTTKVYGFASIELSWTFEDEVYYTYELYASKTKDFTPNTFDLIHAGQSSSFLFQAKPNETWYFKVCAKNTHGERTEFSEQVIAITKKIDDLSNYVDDMAIGEALIGELSLDRGWVGKLNANYLDVKGNFSVTDGNGKRTLDIDSFGNVNLDVNKLSIRSESVATDKTVTNIKQELSSQIGGVSTQVSQIKEDYATNAKVDLTANGLSLQVQKTASPNLVKNFSFYNNGVRWKEWGPPDRVEYLKGSDKYPYCFITTNDSNQGVMQTVSGLMQGVNYVFSAEFSVDTNVDYSMQVFVNGQFKGKHATSTSQGWHRMSLAFRFEKGESIDIYLGVANASRFGNIRVRNVQVEQGDKPTSARPYQGEIYNNIVKIDEDGVAVEHRGGAKSRLTHEAMEFLSPMGHRALCFKDGGMNIYTLNPATITGMIKPSVTDSSTTGTTITTMGIGKYITLGHSDSKDDNNWQSTPALVVTKGMSGIGNGERGVHIVNDPFFVQSKAYIESDMHVRYTLTLGNEKSGTPSAIYSVDNILGVYGDDGTALGIRYGKDFRKAMQVNPAGWLPSYCIVDSYTNFDFHGNKILNANITSLLETLNPRLRLFRSLKPDAPIDVLNNCMSYSAEEIRYSDKENHTVYKNENSYECLIEIPPVLGENVEAKYHVNISKITFGDYRIKERNKFYFIVESDREDFTFTFECVFKKLDTPNRVARRSIIPVNPKEHNEKIFTINEKDEIELQ